MISPWNFPLAMALGDSIPALQAGAAVVVKPSEFTPLEPDRGDRGLEGGDRRPPTSSTACSARARPAAPLVDEVDFVQFTGSDRTGRKVMARAAETLTPVSLELGGKDPMIVLADADVDRAANAAAWGGMFNSGQVCLSVERIYVEEPVYDEFVAKLTKEVAGCARAPTAASRKGRRRDDLAEPDARSIEDHVNDALASGARALTGGKRVEGPGDYYEPTVLVDVDHSMKVMRDETFGPVVGVMKVRDTEEAVRLPTTPATGSPPRSSARRACRDGSPAGSRPGRSTSTT